MEQILLRQAGGKGGISIFALPEDQQHIFRHSHTCVENGTTTTTEAKTLTSSSSLQRSLSDNNNNNNNNNNNTRSAVYHYAQESAFHCNTCGVANFEDSKSFRLHSQSDWHIHNVRLRASHNNNNKAPLTLAEFSDMQNALETPPTRKKRNRRGRGGSNSKQPEPSSAVVPEEGETEADSDDDDDDDEQWKQQQQQEQEEEEKEDVKTQGSFAVGFVASSSPSTTTTTTTTTTITTEGKQQPQPQQQQPVAYLMYKSLLLGPVARRDLPPITSEQHLHMLSVLPSLLSLDRYVILCTSGGRFASGIYRKDRCVMHKTFKKYVMRHKQGGLQHTKDNKGQMKKSIGAEMRRQNWKIFIKQVHGVLEEWKDAIGESELVLIYAPGKTNKRMLLQENQTLNSSDARVRFVHFGSNWGNKVSFHTVQQIQQSLMRVYPVDYEELKATSSSV